MFSLIHIGIAILAAFWFFGRARASGKEPVRWAAVGGAAGWAVVGGAAYLVPASILTGLLLAVWHHSVVQAFVPLEVQFFTTGQVFSLLFAVLLPSTVVGWIVALHVFCVGLASETSRRMNQRTYVFEGAAVLLAAVGWLAGPGLPRAQSSRENVGRLVFPEFTDPLSVVSLEIVRYDKDNAKLVTFQVARDKQGVFSIPSHEGYPADAVEHLAVVARSLKGLDILDVASEDGRHHAGYDVVEPTEGNPGTAGLGMKVTVVDRDQKAFSLVIGKEVPERLGQRYVRVADQSAVLVVKLPTQMFSTEFGDWIEKNLLKIQTEDVKSITMADYSIDKKRYKVQEGGQTFVVEEPVPVRRGRVTVEALDVPPAFPDPARPGEPPPQLPRWKVTEDKIDKDQKWIDGALAPDEELDAAKLDGMKDALRDLKIVDVERKEEVLAKYLREMGKFPPAVQAEQFVAPYGFHMVPVSADILEYLRTLVPVKEKTVELLSEQGDLRVATKEGIVYVLRFGNVASTGRESGKGAKEAAKPAPAAKEPEKKPGEKPGAEEAKPAGANVNRYLFIMAEFDPDLIPKPDLQKPPELPKPGEAPKTEAPKAEPPKTEAPKAEPGKPEAAKKEEPAKTPDPEAERKRIENERKMIEALNKQKQQVHDRRIEDGKKAAMELNKRFADWFYVISESEYQKIHLSRKDILKKKEVKKEEPKKEAAEKPGVVPPVVPPPTAPPGAKEPPKEPAKEAPAPKKEEVAAPKKEPAPAPKAEPAPAPKKEEPPPAPKKEEPKAAPKKDEPAPPKKEEPPPAKKDAPGPAPKPLEPAPVKR